MQFAFEFDEAKSRANDVKHGIDFVEAQALWLISVRRSRATEVQTYEGK